MSDFTDAEKKSLRNKLAESLDAPVTVRTSRILIICVCTISPMIGMFIVNKMAEAVQLMTDVQMLVKPQIQELKSETSELKTAVNKQQMDIVGIQTDLKWLIDNHGK